MMEYEWDPVKATVNYRKHRIRFADAISVFMDEMALTMEDETSIYERRFITLGQDAFDRVLFIVYTYRHETVIRLISARKATAEERQQYEDL